VSATPLEESFDLTVVDVVEETADARSISFAVPEGLADRFSYRPGQFLTLAVPSERTGVVARCYSLSSSPFDHGPLTITVKRTGDGYASGWLCDRVRVGDTVRVLPPSGVFTPRSLDADLLMLAAGSGITPVISIVRAALAEGTGRVVLFYANPDERSVIFAGALAQLAAEHPERLVVVHWLESLQGLPSARQLEAFAAPYASFDAFVCGPAPFMTLAVAALKELGFPRARRHQEKFVSLGGNPFGDLHQREVAEHEMEDAQAEGVTRVEVELDRTHHLFDDWPEGTKLLDHLESKGLDAPYSCREGECSACVVRLLEGEVRMLRNEVLDEEDLAAGLRLGCQSVPASDVVRVTYD
jgi:3-ketosteroid 9alpha-monooxygenase subunit B